MRVFTVTVKYSGQPQREAGNYRSREVAAHAAALLAGAADPNGERPVGVGIHESAGGELNAVPICAADVFAPDTA